jgi:hypothetical protein
MLRRGVILGEGGGACFGERKKPHEAYNNEHIFMQLVLGEEMLLKWPQQYI